MPTFIHFLVILLLLLPSVSSISYFWFKIHKQYLRPKQNRKAILPFRWIFDLSPIGMSTSGSETALVCGSKAASALLLRWFTAGSSLWVMVRCAGPLCRLRDLNSADLWMFGSKIASGWDRESPLVYVVSLRKQTAVSVILYCGGTVVIDLTVVLEIGLKDGVRFRWWLLVCVDDDVRSYVRVSDCSWTAFVIDSCVPGVCYSFVPISVFGVWNRDGVLSWRLGDWCIGLVLGWIETEFMLWWWV